MYKLAQKVSFLYAAETTTAVRCRVIKSACTSTCVCRQKAPQTSCTWRYLNEVYLHFIMVDSANLFLSGIQTEQ